MGGICFWQRFILGVTRFLNVFGTVCDLFNRGRGVNSQLHIDLLVHILVLLIHLIYFFFLI